MSSFHIFSNNSNSNNNSSNKESSTKKSTKKSSSSSDRPLPRAPPPGNFNVDYNSFEVRIPNYSFGKTIELAGAGGLLAISIGKRNKDNKVVLAKISPHTVRLEREYYITRKLYALPGGPSYIPNAIEYVSLVQDGLAALLYTDIQPNDYVYVEQNQCVNYFTLYSLSKLINNFQVWDEDQAPVAKCNEITLDVFLSFAIQCCSALQFLHENGVIHGELRPSAFQCRRDSEKTDIVTKVWSFGGGLNSYEELLLTSSRWRSFMSTNENSNTASNTNSFLIPTPPPLPPPASFSSTPTNQQQHNHYFPLDNNQKSTNNHNTTTSTKGKHLSSRFYSPKEFQTSLVYISPEQTGRTSNALDHRADLYSLGIMFFVILTDRDPFEGTAMDIIHAILSKNVPLIHTIRKDIPPIISLIIDKLTRKTVDERYDSAYGLREDLLECQKRLNSDNPEALTYFPLGSRDVNPVFKVSDEIYGRQKEIELISSIIENTYNLHQKEVRKARMLKEANLSLKSSTSEATSHSGVTETLSPSSTIATAAKIAAATEAAIASAEGETVEAAVANESETEKLCVAEKADISPLKEADNLLRVNSSTSLEHTSCEVIVLKGPGGIGKSTIVSTLNVQARHCGYTASAKFDKNQKRPYNGLLRCLSAILRQLLTEPEHSIREFYKDLKHNLGPQFSNVRLMVNMVPELRPILYDYREKTHMPDEGALSNILNTETRFHAVYLNIIRTIARKKLLTLCLDDLQEADEPSIHLISALIYSRTTMLIILTFRDGEETPQKVIDILEKHTNPVTTIQLHPLGRDGLKQLVLNTFYNNSSNSSNDAIHIGNSDFSSASFQYHEAEREQNTRLETIMPLVDIIYSWTRGNPFYAKQFLKTMKRKDDIWFDWTSKHWKFRLDNIKKLFDNTKQQAPSINKKGSSGTGELPVWHQHQQLAIPHQPIFDVRNLISHLRSLDLSAQYFLMWASLMGHTFNFRRIKWLMMGNTTGGYSSDENSSTTSNGSSSGQKSLVEDTKGHDRTNPTSPVLTGSMHSNSPVLTFEEEAKRSNQAMLGLQTALSEGIIQYKAGNDFHFIHDRYYQAASMLIVDPSQREHMHLKIGQMLMLEEEEEEEEDNIFLAADHLVKSAGLIRLLEKRKRYRDVLIKAGHEATLSGALQISSTYYECALSLLDEDIEKRWQDGSDTSFSETLGLYMKILELKMLHNSNLSKSSTIVTTDNGEGDLNDQQEDCPTIDDKTIVSAKTSIVANGNKFVTATTVVVHDEMRDSMMRQIMKHTRDQPFERAQAWLIQARIYFQQSQYRKGISTILEGLEELGIVVDTNITDDEVLQYYQHVKPSIVKPGFEILAKAGPCQNTKYKAIMTLLNEACTGAYWVNPILVDFFALKLCELSLKYGYTSASGGGFIWVGCTATRVSEFTFAAQLGQFGMAISEKYAGNSEIARSIIVHHTMLAQWTGVHVRDYIYQYQRAYKHAIAGGDQLFSSMALFHVATTLYWTSGNLSELHWHMNHSMEECSKGNSKDVLILNISLWRSVLVFQGKTSITMDPEKMMNDPDSNFDEPSFVEDLKSQSVNSGNPLNWHYSFKMILLFHFGFAKAASELGFKIFDNSVNEAVHRHVGIAMYYHCMAIVESLRDPDLDPATRDKYEKQLHKKERRLNELATYSEVNYRMYHKVVQAQISTLDLKNLDKSLRLYNEVMELALKGNWFSFLGLTFELASEHYMRCGLTMLAIPTLCRSIEFYSRWGAFGKVQYLKNKYAKELATQNVTNTEDTAVQTDDVIVGLTTTVIDKNFGVWDNNSSDETSPDPSFKEMYGNDDHQQRSVGVGTVSNEVNSNSTSDEANVTREDTLFSLDMVDLTSIIKSSQVISNEMNSFDELLKKMIGIIMANSGAESGAIIIKEGMFGIAAYSVRSLDTCQTYEPPLPLRDDESRVSASIVNYVIHTHASLFIPNVEGDARFATGDGGMKKGAVICMPIMHKSTLVGVLYLQANLNAFTHKHANVLALLCDQIGISITNALLFKSVQKATKANALMIESQLKALEEARASREQALHATKMKSNFLANMSHELRTPFSGFYGMISLLNETCLDPEQKELVSIAKQSCEMLLHIIDDLLDFSKLEAHKVKLLHGLFYIEDLIADRIELLVTLATNKNVELSYFIDADVPSIIYGDGNRIGQILMNLIGNAIKFTHHGEVVVRCSLDKSNSDLLQEPDDIALRISVEDTGIGMSEEEIKGLFLPFSQVDGSTTRNFGGTGLGLSICLQLVKLMQGSIHVDSVVNKGSTFSFTIVVKDGDTMSKVDTSYDARNSSIKELQEQLGQPRLLIASTERFKLMVQSFVPWIQHVDHEMTIDSAIESAVEHAKNEIPYDCIVMDSPRPEDLLRVIKCVEDNPALSQLRVLVMLAPTAENVRRHFSNASAINHGSSLKDLQDGKQYKHLFHHLVNRLSKPIRTVKLLNALVKILSNASIAIGAEPNHHSLEAMKELANHATSPSSVSVPPANGRSITNQLDVGFPEAVTATSVTSEANNMYTSSNITTPFSTTGAGTAGVTRPVQDQPEMVLVAPPYSRKNQEIFSPEELAVFKGQKILIAEDNFIAQKLIVKQLDRLGFVVDKCNNGFECFDTWKARGPGYFLLAWIDHHMPGCDGLEATRKIRAYEKEMKFTTSLPIIALTADIQRTAQANCFEAGMNDYVTKPLMQKDLAYILRKYCLGQQQQ